MSVGATLTLRIIVLHPIEGVTLRLQNRKRELVPPSGKGLRSVWFDFDVQLNENAKTPDFLGPFVHGGPGGRFVYINAGRYAGEAGEAGLSWDRRAKVPLAGIPRSLVDRAAGKAGVLIATAFEGRAKDGGPSCATVPLATAWRLVRRGARSGVARP